MFEGAPADYTFTQASDVQCALKQGPMFRAYDCCMITNPRYQRFVLDVAAKSGLPAQVAVRTGGGTDGGVAHLMDNGIPASEDVETSAALCVEVMRSLTPEVIASF